MRILIAAAVAAMTLCLSSPDVFGQGVDMRSPRGPEDKVDDSEALRLSGNSGGRSSIKREPRVLTKGPLAPSAEDRANHTSFLSRSNTGLIRLFSRRFAANTRGDGAYYSFFHRSHKYDYGSDLGLDNTFESMYTKVPSYHELSVGFAGANFGMLGNLGETPLEALTIDDPRTEFMRGYQPPRRESEARSENKRFRQGVTLSDQTYKSRLPVQVGATYLLRSIDYNRSDVLVAFRVVRQDTDGSLIIAWKMLKKYPTPKLALNK